MLSCIVRHDVYILGFSAPAVTPFIPPNTCRLLVTNLQSVPMMLPAAGDISQVSNLLTDNMWRWYSACTHLMGEAAAVEAAVDKPLLVPNFSCLRRTSRGGFAAEFTYAIFTCRPATENNTDLNSCPSSTRYRAERLRKGFSHLWVCWREQRWCSGWASSAAPRARRAASDTSPSTIRTPEATPAWSHGDSDASTAHLNPPWNTEGGRESSERTHTSAEGQLVLTQKDIPPTSVLGIF